MMSLLKRFINTFSNLGNDSLQALQSTGSAALNDDFISIDIEPYAIDSPRAEEQPVKLQPRIGIPINSKTGRKIGNKGFKAFPSVQISEQSRSTDKHPGSFPARTLKRDVRHA